MTGIDVDALTEEAAIAAWRGPMINPAAYPEWERLGEATKEHYRLQARPVVEFVAARVEQDVRQQIAEELCDCKDRDTPPTNPWTKKRIAHHCDCTTVMLTSKPDEYGVRHDHDCGRPGGA